jgi:hypothetical protein
MVWFFPNCFTLLKFVLKDFGHSVVFRYPEPAHQAEQFFIMENIQQFSKVVQFIGGCLHKIHAVRMIQATNKPIRKMSKSLNPLSPGKISVKRAPRIASKMSAMMSRTVAIKWRNRNVAIVRRRTIATYQGPIVPPSPGMPPPPPIAPRPNIGGATGGRALGFFLASGLGGAARLAVFFGGAFLAAIII